MAYFTCRIGGDHTCGHRHADIVEAARCCLDLERDIVLTGQGRRLPRVHEAKDGELHEVDAQQLQPAWKALAKERRQLSFLRGALGQAQPPGVDLLDEAAAQSPLIER